jgi:hypothetical protein
VTLSIGAFRCRLTTRRRAGAAPKFGSLGGA